MKSLLKSFVIASLCLLTASAGYAQQDGKDGKEMLVQQQPGPVSQDEWHFTFTPYFWLPTANLEISVPDVTVGNRTIGGNISVVPVYRWSREAAPAWPYRSEHQARRYRGKGAP